MKQQIEKRQKCEVYKRIVGYLKPCDQANVGKQAEFKDRLVYSKNVSE